MASYELPAVCSNTSFKKIYTTFLISKRHTALQRSWDGDKGVYELTCSECLEDIRCSKKFQRVPTLLWEVLLVLFIPESCKKSTKGSGDVFASCLTPLVEELENLFLDGEEVVYEYPVEKIFDNPKGYAKSCKIHVMLMMVTGDHPAQCKIGVFKNGGSEFCRHDKAQATLVKDSTKPDGWYVYDGNGYQARFPPPSRTVDKMKAALEDAKRSCRQGEKEAAWKKADAIRVAKLLLKSWKEEDIYIWCIKSLAARRKYSKRKIDQSRTSSSVCMIDNAQNDNDLSKLIDTDVVMVSSKDKEEEASIHEDVLTLLHLYFYVQLIDNAQNNNDLSKLFDTDAVMVSSKDKEEEASTLEDVDQVYIPKIPWQNNGDTNDAYQEIKDITSSELCDATLDLISRKSAQKRKATSKLQELLKSMDKIFKMSKVKKKKARYLCLRDKEAILMKWLGTKKVKKIYNIVKPSYIALKKTHSFFKRKGSETTSSTMSEDLVAWLLAEKMTCINFDKVGALSLKDVKMTSED
ncbi:hypothetical protein L7F22_045252 [Adiantum nelumboides]|nr:hypothetical protein [Adiantum nelumboides]